MLKNLWTKERIVDALQTDQFDSVVAAGAEIVEPLLELCHQNNDSTELARKALNQLQHPEAQEKFCLLVIQDQNNWIRIGNDYMPIARYAPRDPDTRALYFFLTKQWGKYETLDFDQSLLTKAYLKADRTMRERLAFLARVGGRSEWVDVVAAARHISRSDDLTPDEWETAIAMMGERQLWSEMWRIAQTAAPVWSVRLLRWIRQTDWMPEDEEERQAFCELSTLAEQCAWELLDTEEPLYVRATLEGHASEVASMTFTPDGKLLITGSNDGKIRLWRLPEALLYRVLDAYADAVTCLAICPDGTRFASGSSDGTVQLWQLPDGDTASIRRDLLREPGSAVATFLFHPDGQSLIMADAESIVQIWRLADRRLITQFQICEHKDSGVELAISPDGTILVSGGPDSIVRLWSVPEGKLLKELEGHKRKTGCIAISSNGKLLASGGNGGTICLRNLPDGNLLHTFKWHGNLLVGDIIHPLPVCWVGFTPDNQLLVSGGVDKKVRLWRVADGEEIGTLEGHHGVIWYMDISADGQFAASAGFDQVVRLWRLPNGDAVKTLTGHAAAIMSSLSFSPDGQIIASSNVDMTARLWRAYDTISLNAGKTARTEALFTLSRSSFRQTTLNDVQEVEKMLHKESLDNFEHSWGEFIITLARWQRRFDFEIHDEPASLPGGEFDIELEG